MGLATLGESAGRLGISAGDVTEDLSVADGFAVDLHRDTHNYMYILFPIRLTF